MKGATKFHEISVGSDGIIRVKELPTDRAYKTTNVQVKRKRRAGVGIEAAVANIDVNETAEGIN